MQSTQLRFVLLLAFWGMMGRPSTAQMRVTTLPLNSQMPAFELLGVDGKLHKPSDWASSRAVVVAFICNHCPASQLYENRLKAIAADYADKDVTVVAIQPDNPNSIHLEELAYTDVGDSYREMKIRAEYRHFNFSYLYDGDTQEVSRMFGPTATPQVFIFDSSRLLRYVGRIDDSPREHQVKRRDAREALNAILAGRPVMVPKTPASGCSTEWVYGAAANAGKEPPKPEPVVLKEVDAEGLKKLAENKDGKVKLVTFWATWCLPCLEEMPELVKMWHMYRGREFEMVNVAVNYPEEKEAVLAALEKRGVSTPNLQFASRDSSTLMKAFDPEWNGTVPYAALLGRDGRVIWKYQGEINTLSLKRLILANLPDDDYTGEQGYWRNQGQPVLRAAQ